MTQNILRTFSEHSLTHYPSLLVQSFITICTINYPTQCHITFYRIIAYPTELYLIIPYYSLEQLVAIHRQLLRKFAMLELENGESKKKIQVNVVLKLPTCVLLPFAWIIWFYNLSPFFRLYYAYAFSWPHSLLLVSFFITCVFTLKSLLHSYSSQ